MVRIVLVLIALSCCAPAKAAKNFVASGASPEFNERVERLAEKYREQHAIAWLGKPLPGDWAAPCPIRIRFAQHQGGGQTSFSFGDGQVFGWQMSIEGTPERLLDAVLPHEVLHTVFASHFRQSLPRWADEGACTTVEHPRARQVAEDGLRQILHGGRAIAIPTLLELTEYPGDVMPLYWQGHSIVSYLVELKGRQHFVRFLENAIERRRWQPAFFEFYGLASIPEVERTWRQWVAARPACQPGQPCFDGQPQTVSPPAARQPAVRPPAPAGDYDPYPGFARPQTAPAAADPQPPAMPQITATASAPPAVDYSGQFSAIGKRIDGVESSVANLAGRVSQIEHRADPRPTEAAPAVPTAGGTSRTGFAGWWKSKSVGEALGGNLGTGLAIAGGVLATGLGVPPLARKIGGMFITRVGNQVGARVGGQVDQFTQQRLSDLEARIGQRHAQHANIVNEGPPSGPQILHSTNFAAIPDNSEGEAWQFASKRYAEDHPQTAVHVRAIQKIKDLYLSGKEPMV